MPSCQAPLCAAAPLSGVVAPTGNAFATHSAISVQGETALDSGREYLANIGLLSSHGSVAPSTPYRDKVALCAPPPPCLRLPFIVLVPCRLTVESPGWVAGTRRRWR